MSRIIEPHFVFDLVKESIANENHRHIIYTGQFQVGLSTLKPSETTTTTIHPHADTMYYVVKGDASLAIEREVFDIASGHAAIIPHETPYTLSNKSPAAELHTIVIQSPPVYDRGIVHEINPDRVTYPGSVAVSPAGTPSSRVQTFTPASSIPSPSYSQGIPEHLGKTPGYYGPGSYTGTSVFAPK